jgi:hypothetical protein
MPDSLSDYLDRTDRDAPERERAPVPDAPERTPNSQQRRTRARHDYSNEEPQDAAIRRCRKGLKEFNSRATTLEATLRSNAKNLEPEDADRIRAWLAKRFDHLDRALASEGVPDFEF